jgi:hypothetical protein
MRTHPNYSAFLLLMLMMMILLLLSSTLVLFFSTSSSTKKKKNSIAENVSHRTCSSTRARSTPSAAAAAAAAAAAQSSPSPSFSLFFYRFISVFFCISARLIRHRQTDRVEKREKARAVNLSDARLRVAAEFSLKPGRADFFFPHQGVVLKVFPLEFFSTTTRCEKSFVLQSNTRNIRLPCKKAAPGERSTKKK